jgi:hypothetical protein
LRARGFAPKDQLSSRRASALAVAALMRAGFKKRPFADCLQWVES